jgi:hypothetical protein
LICRILRVPWVKKQGKIPSRRVLTCPDTAAEVFLLGIYSGQKYPENNQKITGSSIPAPQAFIFHLFSGYLAETVVSKITRK